ncbi:D-alanyl-D-alanine carboxypeptidase family protein [Virgibacillus sp. MSP4-1]|uniref:D-alanyl-D-alanine carboxypeptidase family protein n=1 Tax=Virgibacillus sp. MSP4-1 TaxID=2700081 RepID=UPI00039AD103|nr:D-alanyl-D-alanine carboxypeptidase family protein [Virgibacillus sp. MSP4-1]
MKNIKKMLIIIMILPFLYTAWHPVTAHAAPGVSAENAVLMEYESGRVLFDKNAHQKKSIASITKILTAIVAIEHGDLNETVTVSENAVRTEGSSIYLDAGDKVKLKDLVYGLMLRSGNDAAVAIAEHVGGSLPGFTHLMNQKAQWIGMTDSHFANPHGLEADGHYSTAYDMALLMRYAMQNKTFSKISGTKKYKGENERFPWHNKNKLLTRYPYCIGGKTGYTRKAGRTLVTSAEKDDMKLIVVTLNDRKDWDDHTRLFEWGFNSFDLKLIRDMGQIELSLPGGNTVSAEIVNPVVLPLSKKESEMIESKTYIKEDFQMSDDEVIGKRIYSLNDQVLAERNIIKEPVLPKEDSLFDKVKDLFHQLNGVL